jgi:hypothetical protein
MAWATPSVAVASVGPGMPRTDRTQSTIHGTGHYRRTYGTHKQTVLYFLIQDRVRGMPMVHILDGYQITGALQLAGMPRQIVVITLKEEDQNAI